MKRKDRVEFQKARALKAMRTAIRLKYALLADEEINRVLPELATAFDDAVTAGQPFELDIRSVFEEAEAE